MHVWKLEEPGMCAHSYTLRTYLFDVIIILFINWSEIHNNNCHVYQPGPQLHAIQSQTAAKFVIK